MATHRMVVSLLLLTGALVASMAACKDGGIGVAACNEDGLCDSGDGETYQNCPSDCTAPPVCNDNGVCESWSGETYQNCLSDCPPPVCNGNGICDAGENATNCAADCGPMGCNYNGICELSLDENAMNCSSDCGPTCELGEMTGPNHDFLVHELFIPDTSQSAGDNGIDLDGDGDIDNKLGMVLQLLGSNGLEDDINAMVNAEILSGTMVMMARIKESGNYDGGVAAQMFQGLPGAPPAFNGNDQVTFDPTSPTDLWLCGRWAPPMLETTASELVIAFPMPGLGTLPLRLSFARIETVLDPANPYYGNSTLTPTAWNNVMLGGGLSRTEIENNLVPALAVFIQSIVNQGGSSADTVIDLFDGNCVVLDDIPACHNVIAGEGQCDNTADPPVITNTELLCNALLYSALAPDVDIDGDGENDLLSVGLRVVHAVPVTIVGL